MGVQVTYDTRKLDLLFKSFSEAERLKAIKSAFRKAANVVKKNAAQNLSATGLNNSSAMSKGIRSGVSKKYVGFFVTVRTKKSGLRGFHKNRRGQLKPVLMWAEKGTRDRQTRGRKSFRGLRVGKKKHTGKMKAYGFLRKAGDDSKGQVTEILHSKMVDTLQRLAKKTGCNVTG